MRPTRVLRRRFVEQFQTTGSKLFRTSAVTLGAAAALTSTVGASAEPCRSVSPDYTVALVELYTSQGCSSCPPADQWLSRLPAAEAGIRVIPLSMHIGYWDYIGWKDPFAKKEFNKRQYQLAEHNASGNVYTPEVFVGAGELTQWGHPDAFAKAVSTINSRTPLAHIDVQAQWLGSADSATGGAASRRLSVRALWSADASAKQPQLLLAVKRGGYVTQVKAGENSGASLRNDHVVRAWAGPFKPDASALQTELSVPSSPGDASLIAFAQDAASGAILQAVELPLESCQVADASAR
jgi:hypothetical protein